MNTETNVHDELEKMLARTRRNTLGDLLVRTRERMPEKAAVVYESQRLNYAELDDLVNQTAHAFLADGMKKGDMITVMSKNSLDFIVANFALARIVAIMITINYLLFMVDGKEYLEDEEEIGCMLC